MFFDRLNYSIDETVKEDGVKNKKQKTYYEIHQDNKMFRKRERGIWGFSAFSVILFYLTFMINTATIGDYILSKIPNDKPFMTNAIPTSASFSDSNTTAYYSFSELSEAVNKEVLAEGACVDRAQSIINILKRRYTAFDRIRAALSNNHVQAIRQDVDGSIEFLKLEGRNVVTGKSEFPNGFNKLIDPDVFLEAISYYKPSISISELQKYLDKKYRAKAEE